ncbi:hypothetical protein M5689_008751 [Euphorbia peplus]|nr:hypothetical protein M5689_008751 [Euphorbia peplus]
MGEQDGGYYNAWPPIEPPLLNIQKDEHWRHFDNSVNAVSFGDAHGDLEAQMNFNPKLGYPSPKMTVYANGVSVLMPGDNVPTFIAHPAPVPCPPEQPVCCPHQPHISSSSNPETAPNASSSREEN